jgi:hypothetical protein
MNIPTTIIISLLTFALRHNGYYAFLLLSFFLIFGLRKYWKYILVIIIFSIGLYKIYIAQVNDFIGYENKSAKIVLLCVPLQQIGRTYNFASNLTKEEKRLLDVLATDGKGFANYEAHKSDAVMWSTNPDLIFNNTKAYIWCCFS